MYDVMPGGELVLHTFDNHGMDVLYDSNLETVRREYSVTNHDTTAFQLPRYVYAQCTKK